MKNRIFVNMAGALLAGSLLVGCLAACGSKPAATAADNQAETATESVAGSDWYQEILADQATKDRYPFYQFKDINGDDTPELFLSTTEEDFIGDDQKACLIAYVDGEAATLMEIGENAGEKFYVNEEDHTLTHFSRSSGEGHIEVFTLESGNLNPAGSADSYAQNHDPNVNNAEDTFYLDGEKVSENDFNAFWEPHTQDSNVITYVQIP